MIVVNLVDDVAINNSKQRIALLSGRLDPRRVVSTSNVDTEVNIVPIQHAACWPLLGYYAGPLFTKRTDILP